MQTSLFLLAVFAVIGVTESYNHYRTIKTEDKIYPIGETWKMRSMSETFTYAVSFPKSKHNVTLMIFKYTDGMDMMSMKYWDCPTLHYTATWNRTLSKMLGCREEGMMYHCHGNPSFYGKMEDTYFFVLSSCGETGLKDTTYELRRDMPVVVHPGVSTAAAAPLHVTPLLALVSVIKAIIF